MDEECNVATVRLIETLEQHAYMRMVDLIDEGHLYEACKIADLLKAVGIV